MKTLFALLGLFMFASVSSTDLTDKSVVNDEPTLIERGNVSTSPKKKADLAIVNENGDNVSTSPKKKADILPVTDERGDNVSTSPKKKADLAVVIENGDNVSTSPKKKADLV